MDGPSLAASNFTSDDTLLYSTQRGSVRTAVQDGAKLCRQLYSMKGGSRDDDDDDDDDDELIHVTS